MTMRQGHNRRPMQVTPEEFEQRWAETFGDHESWEDRWEREFATAIGELSGIPLKADAR